MTLDEWAELVTRELGIALPMTPAVRTDVLDLARDAAHGIARPAAPLTTFLYGLAIGAGADPQTALRQLTTLISTHRDVPQDAG